MFAINEVEKQQFESLPIAISLAQIIDGKLKYVLVSKGYCDLFKTNKIKSLEILNGESTKYINKFDYAWVNEVETNFKKGLIDRYNIIYRTKKNANKIGGFLLNICAEKVVSKGEIRAYFSYSDISNSFSQESKIEKLIQEQRTSIADGSTNAIAIIAKKDFKLLYLNQAAKSLFLNIEDINKKITCHKIFKNSDTPCSYCPKFNKNNLTLETEDYFEDIKKYLRIHFSESVWYNQEVYIEYLNDITEERRNKNLFNLYKALIEYKRNSEAEVGALFSFDIVTKKVAFYFVNSTTSPHDEQDFDDVINHFYPTIVGDEDKRKFKEFFTWERILKNFDLEKTESVDYHQQIGDKIVFLRATYNFLINPNSQHPLMIVNVIDISNRAEMEKMIKAIVTYQNEFVMRQDESSQTCVVFARDNNFVGFPSGFSSYKYKDFENLIHDRVNIIDTYGDKRLITCEDRDHIKSNKLYSVTYKIKLGQQFFHKRSLAFRSKDNELFTVVYDVSDLVAEERYKNEKLEDINKKLLEAENEANIANKAKSEFLSRMSHDMRTPLGAIISLANFGIEETNNQILVEYYEQIKENSNYLLSLVNDLLDVQKIETNILELNESVVKVGNTANAIERIVKLKALEKNIKLVHTTQSSLQDKYIILDTKRMKQILVNILNNAIKYTKPGGEVNWSLVLKYIDKKPYAIHTISDNGVGMSKEFLKHMFEPFSKEKNELSDIEGGTGLGLVITKQIVDAMGGTIECESEIGKGTTFKIMIPRKVPTQEQINQYLLLAKNRENIKSYESIKILVCEDVEINQVIIKKILESKKANVIIANNGQEGVNLFKENDFDIILMDIRMPVLDGVEATREIRKLNKNIPIIALSANVFPQDIKRSLQAGMNDHIAKPINRDELFNTISKYLN